MDTQTHTDVDNHGFLVSQTFSFKEEKNRTVPIQLALHTVKQMKFRNSR